MSCSWTGCRYAFQQELAKLNPETAEYAQSLLEQRDTQTKPRGLSFGTAADANKTKSPVCTLDLLLNCDLRQVNDSFHVSDV
jgi:hypothetical protein